MDVCFQQLALVRKTQINSPDTLKLVYAPKPFIVCLCCIKFYIELLLLLFFMLLSNDNTIPSEYVLHNRI